MWVCDSQWGASRSLRDRRSCPPWPRQRPSDVCWSQWPVGLPGCWDGHWVATCMWSVRRLAQICMSSPLERRRKGRQHKKEKVSSPLIQYEAPAVNTGALLPQQIQYLCCVTGAQAACSVSLYCITPLQSAEQHITLQQLSAPSGGLSTLVSIHKRKKIHLKLGRQVLAPFSQKCCAITQIYRRGLAHSWVRNSRNFRSCPWRPGKLPNWHLFVTRSSLAASKSDAVIRIIDWPVQLCPSSDLQTIHFLFYCITSSPLPTMWEIWPWPGRWKSGSNYLTAVWESVVWH